MGVFDNLRTSLIYPFYNDLINNEHDICEKKR